MAVRAVQLDVYRTAIPMRRFEHAASRRDLAEAVVVRVRLSNGSDGWGETLPRPYVTGETIESVQRDIEEVFWPRLARGDWTATDQAFPWGVEEVAPPAARCAVELAWTDALARSAGRSLGGGLPRGVRVSGVLGSADPRRTARMLRWMRCLGLRDFKLKLGLGERADEENLRVVRALIGRAVARGKCTLRADVNGAWPAEETPRRVAALVGCGVCAVEQPCAGPAERLIELAARCPLPLIADESMVTVEDAIRLITAPEPRPWLNVRLSKNGGFSCCRHILEAAAAARTPCVVGCMVGESSILSAAQRALLASAPAPRFVEGNYGVFLLRDDLTRRSLNFGLRGRLKPLTGPGLGVEVDPRRLARYATLVKSLRS